MARRTSSAPLSVEEAKARVRLAAARAEPRAMMEGAIRSSPWGGVAVFLAVGLLIGLSPGARQAASRLVAGALGAVGRR